MYGRYLSDRNSATFLLGIVNDILDFSKIEAGRLDIEAIPFRPAEIVNSLIDLMQFQAAEKNLSVIYDTNVPPETIVVGDPGRLRQILANLLSNAIKFTAQGSVTLKMNADTRKTPSLPTERSITSDTPVRDRIVEGSRAAITFHFAVEDTGCGISETALVNLFQPFNQADATTARTHGGTGLGLSIR